MNLPQDLYHGILNGLHVVIKKSRIPQELLDNSEVKSLTSHPWTSQPYIINIPQVLREVVLFRQLHHPNILPFLGVCFDQRGRLDSLTTIYMKHGNIVQFLESHPSVNRLTIVCPYAYSIVDPYYPGV